MSEIKLLILPSTLKNRSVIHSNIDDKLIKPEISIAQDMFIMPLLGTALYNKMLDLVGQYPTEAAMPASSYKTLLNDYIINALVYFVLSELPQGLNYQFWNSGVVSTQKEQASNPSMSDMFAVVSRYKKVAEHYANRCRLYLVQNEGSFPEYRSQNGGVDTVYPEIDSFSSQIYLGEAEFKSPNASFNPPWYG